MGPERELEERSRRESLVREPREVGRAPVRELEERFSRVRELSSWSEEGREPVIFRAGRAREVMSEVFGSHEMPGQEQTSPRGEESSHSQPCAVIWEREPRLVESRRSQQALC